jgi:hypothetical protein
MRKKKCDCGTEIVFLPTQSGKTMPINADSVREIDRMYIHGRHVPHFATCPDAKRHRKKRDG